MAGTDRPAWYSIAYVIFVAFCIALMSLINSFQEHRRPSKPYMERSYKSGSSIKKNDVLKNVKERKGSVKVENKAKSLKKESSANKQQIEKSKLGKDESDKSYFQNLVGNYKGTVLSKLKKRDSRTDIVIRYYSKLKDNGLIYGLRKYGFYIHERPSDPSYENSRSNALYFGDDVKNEDIQLVSYLLLEAGVELKKILPSKLHDDWKSNSIEIGTDTLYQDLPTLQLNDIRKNWN